MLNPLVLAEKLVEFERKSPHAMLSVEEMFQAITTVFGTGVYLTFACEATKSGSQQVLTSNFRISCIAGEAGSKCFSGNGKNWQEAWARLLLDLRSSNVPQAVTPQQFEKNVEVLTGQRTFPLVDPGN